MDKEYKLYRKNFRFSKSREFCNFRNWLGFGKHSSSHFFTFF